MYGAHLGFRAAIAWDHAAIRRKVRALILQDKPTGETVIWRTGPDSDVMEKPVDERAVNAFEGVELADYLIDVPEAVARALYDALRDYFGDANTQTVKHLTDLLKASEEQRAKLQEGLVEISRSLTLQHGHLAGTVPSSALRKPDMT